MVDNVLQVNHVSKTFGGQMAVKDVSFSVRKGQITGFLGPNGAGKTTTLRMSLGIIKPDTGHTLLFDQPPNGKSMHRVGFLPEERGVYRRMTAENVIIFFARLKGVPTGIARKRARIMLERFGLKDAISKKIKEMSKGMAQKVQIIAALVHEPEFIILDEPFSGLDPVNQSLLEQIIREQAERGSTVLFSTHVMEHAERLCDSIVLMARGRKLFDGTVDAALQHVPRQIILAAPPSEPIEAHLAKFGALECDEENDDEIVWRLTLKAGADPQAVLRACVEAGIKLTRFEPKRPHLHDAFVALVGEDETGDVTNLAQAGVEEN